MRTILILFFLFLAQAAGAQQQLAEAAKERLSHTVIYDGAYQSIAYPNGDVADNRGVCSDVVIRSYRSLNVDLQKRIHEDMLNNFADYPNIWGLKKPDSNIDHRRVPNLETFFKRKGISLVVSNKAKDYQPGDLVSWRLDNNLPHIGIVSFTKSKKDPNRYKIIHNIGWGPKLDDMLFDFKIVGHFRY